MEQDAILHALMSALAAMDQLENSESPDSDRSLSDILREELSGISNHLQISAVSGKAVVYPTAFPINPSKEMFFASFDLDTSRKIHDYTRRVSLGANGYCEIRISPGADASWDNPEVQQRLSALARFLEIILDRFTMIKNVSRLPLIDMSSGLLNSNGMREVGGQLLSEGAPEKYAGVFLNLKDMKLFSTRYSERIIESFLIRVSHKIFSFLDTDEELGAHYGGDNFYVLILKERLQDFKEFLTDASVEVHGADAPQYIPFAARMGIYEGSPEDHIGIFMTNASVALQVAKRMNEDYMLYRPEFLSHMR